MQWFRPVFPNLNNSKKTSIDEYKLTAKNAFSLVPFSDYLEFYIPYVVMVQPRNHPESTYKGDGQHKNYKYINKMKFFSLGYVLNKAKKKYQQPYMHTPATFMTQV